MSSLLALGFLITRERNEGTTYLTLVYHRLLMMLICCLGLYEGALIYDEFIMSHSYCCCCCGESSYIASLMH